METNLQRRTLLYSAVLSSSLSLLSCITLVLPLFLRPITRIETNFGAAPETSIGVSTGVKKDQDNPYKSAGATSSPATQRERLGSEIDPLTAMLNAATEADVVQIQAPLHHALIVDEISPIDKEELAYDEALATFLSSVSVKANPAFAPPVFPTLFDAVKLSRENRWDKALIVVEKTIMQRFSTLPTSSEAVSEFMHLKVANMTFSFWASKSTSWRRLFK